MKRGINTSTFKRICKRCNRYGMIRIESYHWGFHFPVFERCPKCKGTKCLDLPIKAGGAI
jgi:DnaJ-class molecular chaperone